MSHKLLIFKKVQKELSLLPQKDYEKIKQTIVNLECNPRPNNCLKLSGREAWRLRLGNYRVIYEIDDKEKTITIIQVGDRKFIYKKK